MKKERSRDPDIAIGSNPSVWSPKAEEATRHSMLQLPLSWSTTLEFGVSQWLTGESPALREGSAWHCVECFGEMSYFLKRFSKAARASYGLEDEVSRSMVVRGAKEEHSFRASFLGIRAVTGLVHSNRLAVSKNEHCLQLCSAIPHCGHFPCGSVVAGRIVAHDAQRHTVRCPGIVGVRGPNNSIFSLGRLSRSSRSESI